MNMVIEHIIYYYNKCISFLYMNFFYMSHVNIPSKKSQPHLIDYDDSDFVIDLQSFNVCVKCEISYGRLRMKCSKCGNFVCYTCSQINDHNEIVCKDDCNVTVTNL
jgi:hypothetical protein